MIGVSGLAPTAYRTCYKQYLGVSVELSSPLHEGGRTPCHFLQLNVRLEVEKCARERVGVLGVRDELVLPAV